MSLELHVVCFHVCPETNKHVSPERCALVRYRPRPLARRLAIYLQESRDFAEPASRPRL